MRSRSVADAHPVRPSRLANLVSQVGSPPVVIAAAVMLLAGSVAEGGAWTWGGVHLALAVVLPAAGLVLMLMRGKIEDLEIVRRDQRLLPQAVSALGAGAAAAVLALGGAPEPLRHLALAIWWISAAVLAITFYWKISVHSAAAAAAATLAWLLSGSILLPAAGTGLIAWSRIRLRRHTPAQTLAGALLGFGVLRLLFAGA